MKILISNDDGIESLGILKLAEVLSHIAKVTVVAPMSERSTTGHSLTLHKPLRCIEVKENYYAVSGSPADCVYMATRKIMKEKPDLIVSGINRGANLGGDIYYSGTVAAAREGAYFGIKSIAVSLTLIHPLVKKEFHFETAAEFTKMVIPYVLKSESTFGSVININVPNKPISEIKGVRISKQGRRFYSDEITERLDPRQRPYYWVGGQYKGFENIPGSDCVHVDEGYISVTPLKLDSTDYDLIGELKKWEINFGP